MSVSWSVGARLLGIVRDRELGLGYQVPVAGIAHPPRRRRRNGQTSGIDRVEGCLDDARAAHRGAVGRNPAGFADDDFENQVGQEEALALPGIGLRADLLGAEAFGERPIRRSIGVPCWVPEVK